MPNYPIFTVTLSTEALAQSHHPFVRLPTNLSAGDFQDTSTLARNTPTYSFIIDAKTKDFQKTSERTTTINVANKDFLVQIIKDIRRSKISVNGKQITTITELAKLAKFPQKIIDSIKTLEDNDTQRKLGQSSGITDNTAQKISDILTTGILAKGKNDGIITTNAIRNFGLLALTIHQSGFRSAILGSQSYGLGSWLNLSFNNDLNNAPVKITTTETGYDIFIIYNIKKVVIPNPNKDFTITAQNNATLLSLQGKFSFTSTKLSQFNLANLSLTLDVYNQRLLDDPIIGPIISGLSKENQTKTVTKQVINKLPVPSTNKAPSATTTKKPEAIPQPKQQVVKKSAGTTTLITSRLAPLIKKFDQFYLAQPNQKNTKTNNKPIIPQQNQRPNNCNTSNTKNNNLVNKNH
jgi:hypothetical protein